MKIICKQEKLIKALNIVSRAVSQTSPMPITRGILIRTDGDTQVSLHATDIQISITTKTDALVNEPGGVVVAARLFIDLVRKLPAGDILIATDEKNKVSVKTDRSEYEYQGKDEGEFPRIDIDEEGTKIKIDKDEISGMIDGTAFAASTDESRGVITGVLFEIKEGMLSLAALDGYRVAIRRERDKAYEGNDVKAIVPARLMREISKILAETDDEEEAEIDIGGRRLKLFTAGTQIRANLLEGDYIKYNDVIPKENRTTLTTGREGFLSAVERAAMLKSEGKNAFIRVSIKDDGVTVSSRAEEGSGRETVIGEKSGENLEIGFDAKFLMDALKAIPDDTVELQFNTSVSPCLIKPTEGDAFDYLILPVRLSTVSV